EEGRVLVLRSEISTHLGHYDDAVRDLIDAEELADQLGSEHLKCYIEIDRGNLLYYQQRRAEALEHYQRARELALRYHMPGAYKNALFNVASVLFDMHPDAGGAAAATALLDGALSQFSQDPRLAADIHTNVAMMQHRVGDEAHALRRMRSGMYIRERIGDSNGLASDAYYLASILWGLGQHDSAFTALQRSLDLAARTGDMQLASDAEMKMHSYLKELGRTEQALTHLEAYSEAKDSLIAIAGLERAANLEIQYGTVKKERALKAKEVELGDANAAKRRREVQLLWSVGAGVMLATVLLLLFRNNQHIKRLREKERVVHAQEVNDLMRQQEIRTLDAMMEGQERERKRVAQDLHDRLGSMLSAIKLQFSALEGRMEQLRADQKQQYDHVFTLLDDAVGEVRRISHDMVKSSLTRFGLKGALEDLHSTVHVPGKLEIEMSLFGLDDRLDQRVEIAVYRMVQESINNALRHAKARHITVQVTRSAAMLNLIVEDDGVGFDPAQVSEGMGMGNLRRRAAEVGGTVRIDTRPGRGTSISVDIPLPGPVTVAA
ncbi:MAG TPA: sensor histidine kinase, partial [Flavobacteriales bacterium]|nr:sensor histidine kinase [Flavobacteriales bacterium]